LILREDDRGAKIFALLRFHKAYPGDFAVA
jgi:hypothetical protein